MSVQLRRFIVSGTALVFALAAVGVGPAAHADAPAPSMRPAVASAVPLPPSKALPAALDVYEPYEPQVSCDPRPKPGVIAFAALMTARYTGATGTFRTCQGDTSEHYDSRALDWTNSVNVPRQKAVADSVVAWLSGRGGVMARRFGIMYIIWNKKIWGEYAPGRGWAPYHGADPHTSHIHFSFTWDGAMKRTSWWTGRATTVADLGPCQVYAGAFAPLYRAIRTTACPTRLPASPVSPYKVAVFGQQSAQITVAQRRLGVIADGQFGIVTFTKLISWQTRARVPITGVLDKATWRRLV
jgi:Putative peptidoglycan binding domain